jgi:hypothetical protein
MLNKKPEPDPAGNGFFCLFTLIEINIDNFSFPNGLLFGLYYTNYYLKTLIVQLTVIFMREYRMPDPKDDVPGPKTTPPSTTTTTTTTEKPKGGKKEK